MEDLPFPKQKQWIWGWEQNGGGDGMRGGRKNHDWDVRKKKQKKIAICLREITGEGEEIM